MSASPKWAQQDLWSLFDVRELAEGGLEQYLVKSLGRVAEWFGVSGASVFVAGEDLGQYRLRACAGKLADLPGDAVVYYGHGIAGAAIAEGVPRIIGDPAQVPSLARLRVERRSEIASSMVIPLIEPTGVCVGVMNLSRGPSEPAFGADELELARALASHLTLAVSNARLVERLHAALAQSIVQEQRLRSVMNAVGGATLLVDSDHRIIERNQPAAALFGQSADFSKSLRECPSEVLAKEVRRALRRSASGPRRVSDPALGRTWMVDCVPSLPGGSVLSVAEVTEHERTLTELERLSRLAEMGQMTAAIAHEIRNPVTGIRAAAQALADDPDLAIEFAAIIEDEALKLDFLCDEFLEFARPTQIEADLDRLSPVLHKFFERVRPSVEAGGHKLLLRSSGESGTKYFDERRIEQVLHNLVRNARQASHPGGRVWVEETETGFQVRDEGEGIGPDQLERLFSPFFTTKPDGTGLGLCTVRKLVEAMGGSIRLAPSEVGACFAVALRSDPL